MPRWSRAAASVAVVLAVAALAASPAQPSEGPPVTTAVQQAVPAYPETRRGDVVEDLFGERIADPYRWLENDVRVDARVAAWVDAQNAVTHTYLGALEQRQWFKDKLRLLLDYERFGLPVKAGGRYFY